MVTNPIKMNKITLLLVAIFLCTCSLNSQDLIESTLKGITQKKSNKVNGVAKSILQKSQFTPKSLFQYAGNDLQDEDKEFLDKVVRLNLDLSSLKSLKSLNKKAAHAIRIEMPVSENKKFHLLLQEVDILEPDYFLETSDGQIIYPDKSKIAFYRGIVEGNNNSVAHMPTILQKWSPSSMNWDTIWDHPILMVVAGDPIAIKLLICV